MIARLSYFLNFFILFLLFAPHLALASDSSSNSSDIFREQAIQREFDCIEKLQRESANPTWKDVCYTGPAWESHQERRTELINQALDSADSQRTGQPKDEAIGNGEKESRLGDSPGVQKEYAVKTEDRETNVIKRASTKVPQPRYDRYESAIHLKETQFELGTEFFQYSYKEPVFDLVSKGFKYGVFGSYIYRPKPGEGLNLDVINMYKVDARFSNGPIDYSSTGSGTLDNEDDYAFETRGVIGYDHFFHDRFLATPYGGLGFRYLNNDSGGRQTTTGAYGYERVSNYLYLPLGADLVYQTDLGWQIAPNFEWDIFLFGKQTSYLSDVDSGLPDLENEQNRGYGVRGALKIIKPGSAFNIWIEPFFRYWHIHNSKVTTAVGNVYALTGLEPDNNTTEYGLKLGVAF